MDSILSERVATEAAEPLGVPVFPGLAYGLTPHFMAYPGTVTWRMATCLAVVTDMLAIWNVAVTETRALIEGPWE